MARSKRARRPAKRRATKPPVKKRGITKQRPARHRPAAPGESPRPLPSAKPPPLSPAETGLLTLARALTALAAAEHSPRAAVAAALEALGGAFDVGAPLPRALTQARNAALRDKTRALAITWAREQLRLSLGEILARAAAAGDVRVALPAESLAWLVLAACEALADEPRGAAPDRLRLLAEWLTGE